MGNDWGYRSKAEYDADHPDPNGWETSEGWYDEWTPEPFPGKQPEHIEGQLSLED